MPSFSFATAAGATASCITAAAASCQTLPMTPLWLAPRGSKPHSVPWIAAFCQVRDTACTSLFLEDETGITGTPCLSKEDSLVQWIPSFPDTMQLQMGIDISIAIPWPCGAGGLLFVCILGTLPLHVLGFLQNHASIFCLSPVIANGHVFLPPFRLGQTLC